MRYETLLLYYAIPYFTISMLVELFYARYRGDRVSLMDTLSSLSSGMTNILKDTLKLGIAIITYGFLLSHVQLWHWSPTPLWIYAFCFLYIDFTGYWVHRIEHRVNFFWNQHIIHHSSEEFNLACALRQPFSDIVGFFTIFYLPMAIVGVPVGVIGIVAPIHLFLQFWYHTRYIRRIPVLEQVIVTPSHHRVHHAMNGIYMDKNFGQIFIFWDKLFGTYQEELSDLEPVYGVRRPVKTWNPYLINFKHLWLLILDAWRTDSYRDKLRVWYMPTGWRPADVEARYPVEHVDDMSQFTKFDPSYSTAFMVWSTLQLIFSLGMLCFLFYRIEAISDSGKIYYGAFLLLSIFAYTAVMDRRVYGVVAAFLQAAMGIGLVISTGDWFGMRGMWSGGPLVVAAFLALSAASALYFLFTEFSSSSSVTEIKAP